MLRADRFFRFLGNGVTLAVAIALLLAIGPGCSFMKKVEEVMRDEPQFSLGSPDSVGLVIINCDVFHDPQGSTSLSFSSNKSIGESIMESAFEGLAGALFGPDAPAKTDVRGGAIVDDRDHRVGGKQNRFTDHAIVFPGLQPGQYRLTEVEATHDLNDYERSEYYECGPHGEESSFYSDDCPDQLRFNLTLPSEASEVFGFDVEPGQLVYLGKVILVERSKPPYGIIWDESHSKGGVLVKTKVDKHSGRIEGDYALDPNPDHEIETLENLIHYCDYYEEHSWTPILRERLAELRQMVPATE